MSVAEPEPEIEPTGGASLSAKQQQGVRSREEILDAAEHLMGRRGYTATSISTVAKESGLPASSIYWHFGSKSGLLGAVMERGSQRFFDATPGAVDSEEPLERLRGLLQGSLRNVRAHPQFLRLFIVLLLGAEGEHAQDDVVIRVRGEGQARLRRGLLGCYLPWGEPTADLIAERLQHMVLALFDGLFLASEVAAESGETSVPDSLVGQMAMALHALALDIRAGNA